MKRAKLEAPESVFVLMTSGGKVFDLHKDKQDAHDDATGPAFRPHFYIQEYKKVGRAKKVVYK